MDGLNGLKDLTPEQQAVERESHQLILKKYGLPSHMLGLVMLGTGGAMMFALRGFFEKSRGFFGKILFPPFFGIATGSMLNASTFLVRSRREGVK